ncbi:MAG: hypothetical protein A2157_13705 [Deltaproteobacteria bacterium RBG_16_47_11]|nr:MAG: hypothetical protein A2157_13705 [Deltaproteobacteria bacterium RBG_16_47_11]
MEKNLTYIVYIERVGPNHTLESFLSQNPSDPELLEEFEMILPPPMRNRYYSSRLRKGVDKTTVYGINKLPSANLPKKSLGKQSEKTKIHSGGVR